MLKPRIIEHQDAAFGVGPKGELFLDQSANSSWLVEACGNALVDRPVLILENLPEGFFDLSFRVAGEVLNKLQMYRVCLAVVRTPWLRLSNYFGEMLAGERRYWYFALFHSLECALDWLSEG